MVDISRQIQSIRKLVEAGAYVTIHRARQYGKTTTLTALADQLQDRFGVLLLDFQRMRRSSFADEPTFCKSLAQMLLRLVTNKRQPVAAVAVEPLERLLGQIDKEPRFAMDALLDALHEICELAAVPLVLIIDEVDGATHHAVFIEFLAQLRADYLAREHLAVFQSVILAGVYDIKHVRDKIRDDSEHAVNSPWNIAHNFDARMSFSAQDVAGMLADYEADHHTGMDVELMARLITESTNGYPFLVSRLCQMLDEGYRDRDLLLTWTPQGYRQAEKRLTQEKNMLFDSLTGKVTRDAELAHLLQTILFEGKSVSFAVGNPTIDVAALLGLVKNDNQRVTVANRIFETVIYNLLLSREELRSDIYAAALTDVNAFVRNGRLDMKLVLERFVVAFTELYHDRDDAFKEEMGRKFFMLFLKPIINGTGHCYVEARTRNMLRTDLVVDYRGEQFVVELKIWRGPKYHDSAREQIIEYLKAYGLKTGYILTFNFNQNKTIGLSQQQCGPYLLIEATV